MKIQLPPPRAVRGDHGNTARTYATHSLPFFQPKPEAKAKFPRCHRVKGVTIYHRLGVYSHTAVTYWCANTGFDKEGAQFKGDPGDTPVCAVCEERATNSPTYPQRSAVELCGHEIRLINKNEISQSAVKL